MSALWLVLCAERDQCGILLETIVSVFKAISIGTEELLPGLGLYHCEMASLSSMEPLVTTNSCPDNKPHSLKLVSVQNQFPINPEKSSNFLCSPIETYWSYTQVSLRKKTGGRGDSL